MTRNPFAVGGGPGSAPWNVRRSTHPRQPAGLIRGSTPGRRDAVPTSVRNGSFVVPADTLSALGEGNSQAGAEILGRMLKTGSYGSDAMRGIHRADGGGVEVDDDGDVPIQASDGEFLIDPETVAEIGHGDLKAGYRVLEKFVLRVRKEHIASLRKLKGPKL